VNFGVPKTKEEFTVGVQRWRHLDEPWNDGMVHLPWL